MKEAMGRAGLGSIAGLNSGKLIGYSTMTAAVDIRTATRDSSETSFLQTGAQASKHLKIYPNTLVKRITFDGEKRAKGVDVQANLANVDLDFHLSARKEVIVSAGVWHSPQLLMVSGVGPPETLSQYGIDLVSDLPGVGQNAWVSMESLLSFESVSPNTLTGSATRALFVLGQCLHKHPVSSWQPGHRRTGNLRLSQLPIWSAFGRRHGSGSR